MIKREPIPVNLPTEFTPDIVAIVKKELLQAVFEGHIDIDDADRLPI